MKQSIIVALSAVLLSSAALTGTATAAPQCDYTGDDEAGDTEDFAQSRHLEGKFGATVTVWNGCYKVQHLQNGKFVTEYYDPDSEQRVF
ncbi:hypothetical protein VW23_019745 [Devosia insulae DS-56]|uniref:PepSY domain-containing protein n=1 Tax=Devosia insulae DS-56 TaxID=1116389 RepID=A0A1E5XQB0_9HYPH|nr:hypothetical protein [Devosia insulae]OEO30704.1 hypothetical protein VW23_019745 [Devosia insulae DS-56]